MDVNVSSLSFGQLIGDPEASINGFCVAITPLLRSGPHAGLPITCINCMRDGIQKFVPEADLPLGATTYQS